MTAATVDEPVDTFTADTIAEELGLEHPGALVIATYPTELRRAAAARAVDDRRAALGLYVTLYEERYGHRLDLRDVISRDDLYAELTLLAIA